MKIRFLIIALFFSVVAFGQQWVGITSPEVQKAGISLEQSNIQTSVINFDINGYYLNKVNTGNGESYTISLPGGTPVQHAGSPDLPKLTASVIIPDLAQMDVRVLESDYVEVQNISIAPSKGNLFRDVDPATVPFTFGKEYEYNAFYPSHQADLRDPYILRDYRGQTVIVYPFTYNPVTQTLRIYTHIKVEVTATSQTGINTFSRTGFPTKVDAGFAEIYKSQFLNAAQLDNPPLGEYGKMLVISHANYLDAMKPFVDWKNSMGIETEMVDVASIGSNAIAIKNYIADNYVSNGLTYVLLVGDGPQIPTNTSGVAGPSDNAYGYIVGNDHYPDLIIGRFSAENVDHVNTMVNRTLEYEKDPLISSDWFSKGLGIGSDQGPGDDGEYDYQHIRNIRTQLMDFTYTDVAELYDGSQGGEDEGGNPNQADVSAVVNAGIGLANYVGHGSDNSWVTTGFSNTSVNQLTNNHKWPFIWSVACVNGNFTGGTCFAEAWLRAKNNNGPTGAIATLMSTINQSWNPPMEGQDQFNAIATHQYPNNIKYRFGGVAFNGLYLMNDKYGSDGSDMTDTWTIFGDPSVLLRTVMPEEFAVTHPEVVFLGQNSLQISCDFEDALIGLSVDGQFLDAGFVSGGQLILNFDAFQAPDTLLLVATSPDKLPYIAEIPVVPNNNPYLVFSKAGINDASGNNNQLADYNETIQLNIELANIGLLPAEGVNVTLSSTDPYITISDNTEIYDLIPATDTMGVADGFTINLLASIPDQYQIPIHFLAECNAGSWSGNFSISSHAGILKMNSFSYDDSQSGNNNNVAEPGETFNLKVVVKNTGSASAMDVMGQLSFNEPLLTLLSDNTVEYGDINAGQFFMRTFTLKSSSEIPSGTLIPAAFLITGDWGFEVLTSFNIVIGQTPVCVIDLDGNHNSGSAIVAALQANDIMPEYRTDMPSSLDEYQALFICLGMGSSKHEISMVEGQKITSMLQAGGKVYMEGGDTWYNDAETSAQPMFKINGLSNGGNDLGTLNSNAAAFTSGISFNYEGDNTSVDRISPSSPAFQLFKNASPLYVAAVGYDAGNYKTVGSNFEFSGLTDAAYPSTKNEYMHRIIEFFGLGAMPLTANFVATPTSVCEDQHITFINASLGNVISYEWSFPEGNPASSTDANPVVSYSVPGTYDVSLIIYDGITYDTLIKDDYILVNFCADNFKPARSANLTVSPNPAQDYITLDVQGKGAAIITILNMQGKVVRTVKWDNTANQLSVNISELSNGVYTIRVNSNSAITSTKLIVNK